MKHVRITLDAGGSEAEIHPMYDVMANAPYVDRATAMHWNVAEDEFGIMHYVEGDREPFVAALEAIPEVLAYELTPASPDAFYVFIRDATTESARDLFETITRTPVVVIPPIEYAGDGTVSYSAFGPSDAIQAAIDEIPDLITVTIDEIGGLAAAPGVLESLLSDRQREAIDAALDLGYYEIPREADHRDVASALDCAPSTAAEHLRKAEAKLVESILDG
ncbi:helix-turn-helix domain-containing protein [Natrinema sp. 1APR25-10V2]|uniref:helix-turn-helix domain-containing protein n=1 Tax=Natrinema sp. 1APR25-10V2 TaxID=2951081 RepID=UPI002875006E|nr:helix-turn-helix domain-containing protein [Natrinema sp. 1APR25-10V2]MDS0476618.1 helix-turn-helix domain-containing protein [Natrinema sp. 1APR25-10V2]